MDDISWPLNSKKGRSSLMSLCVDYGVPVWQAHRALTDCIYLAEVMKREPQLEQLIENALLPRHVYVSNLGYQHRQLCKDAGFTWNDLVPKMWARKMTEHEAAALDFSVSIAD
jgi:DNA polymerase-3 subunit epsilon